MGAETGYVELTSNNQQVIVRIYHETTAPYALIDGPRGDCLDITNLSGRPRKVTYKLPDGTVNEVNVPEGDPVRSVSRTAAQLAAAGYTTRNDFAGITLE